MTPLSTLVRRRETNPRLYESAAMFLALVIAVGAAITTVISPLLVILAAAAGVFAALVLKRPDSATLVVLLLLYSNAPTVAMRHHGLPFAVGMAFPILLLAPLAYHALVRRKPLRLGIAGPLLIVLALAHLISAVTSADWSTTVATTGLYLTNGVALYLLLVNVLRSEETIRRAVLIIVGVAAALGAVAYLHTLISEWPGVRAFGFSELRRGDLLEPVDWGEYFSTAYPASELRAAGPIGESNFFAFTMVLALPYALAFVVAPRYRLERAVALLAVPWLLVGVLLTYSRGAGVTIAVVTAVLAFAGLIPRSTLLALAGGAVLVLAAVPDYAQRLLRLTTAPLLWLGGPSEAVSDAALTGRYSEMVSAAYAWADRPILGLGPGAFPDNYQRYARDLGFTVHEGPREAHNLYLHYAAELGTIGLALIIGILFVLLRHLMAVRRLSWDGPSKAFTVAGMAVVGVIAVNAMFLHLAFERYLWLHVAIIAAWCAEGRRHVAGRVTDGTSPPLSTADQTVR